MKNIAFVANQVKTSFFELIAETLIAQGYSVYWVTVSPAISDHLSQRFGENRVLFLDRTVSLLEADEINMPDLKLNEIIQSDRSLRVQQGWAKQYLRGVQALLYKFISNHNIRFVFGEVTWAHELIALRLTLQVPRLKCTYLNPHTVRIPDNYFGFFNNETQSVLFEVLGSEARHFVVEAKKPEYLVLNNEVLKKSFTLSARLKKVGSFIFGLNDEKENGTKFQSKLLKLKNNLIIEINRVSYLFQRRFRYGDLPEEVKANYVIYPLHKQPEASIDVIGRYYDDQYLNVLNIWRGLPDGWSLLVKEHSNAVGDRGYSFYRKISRLEGVYLVHEQEDSYAIINGCRAVFTVSGTAAYEAALLGRPSFTFAPCFFNRLNLCRQITLADMQRYNVSELIEAMDCEGEGDFSAWLSNKIFPGIISDPASNLKCMESGNIQIVSDAFLSILRMR
ncbi:hypothetical protein NAV33_11930 [Pseudomonas stutzeri]|uniref:hypothetical protein n=1 Tax=Stutzerimonas stutzeri TaxID=316 RepID=UPI00210DE951|nr:hypothetical protein [Stutzerimonas stutzeri]MCQ4312603.1 hypothetical protein [Stutzerimonas stutzeri]